MREEWNGLIQGAPPAGVPRVNHQHPITQMTQRDSSKYLCRRRPANQKLVPKLVADDRGILRSIPGPSAR